MSDDVLQTTRSGQILEVVLDRPKANAIDAATSRQMGEIFAGFRDDPDLRVAIFTGAGNRFFCAGWDLKAAAEGEDFEADYGVGGFGGFPELPDLNKPVIAAVNGLALGGGFEIALAADLMIAVEDAEFYLPEPLVGVMPDAGAIRLPRALPRAVANEMLLTSKHMSAQEAELWGLVNEVCKPADLMDRARELAERITAAAPLSIAAIKETVRSTEAMTLSDAYAHLRSGEVKNYKKMLESEDAEEGPRAFAEKRDPVWTGR